jgi:amino acid transporter
MCPQGEATAPQTANVGLASAVALGIGGMIGAGLYSMLGIASGRSGTWLPLAFLVGAVAAAFSV